MQKRFPHRTLQRSEIGEAFGPEESGLPRVVTRLLLRFPNAEGAGMEAKGKCGRRQQNKTKLVAWKSGHDRVDFA